MPATRDLEGEMTERNRGQTRAAKATGQRYFQVFLAAIHPYQVWSSNVRFDQARATRYGDQGPVLTDIEEEGWKLIHMSAAPVDAESKGQVRDREGICGLRV